jgi:hypothetical protein
MNLIWRIQPVRWIVVFWSIAAGTALLADEQRAIDIGDRKGVGS